MTDLDQTTLWVGATRYYLGRQTYAVQMFCELLANHWDTLGEGTRIIIRRDIEREFQRDDEARVRDDKYKPLGADCDRQQWENIRKLWV